MKKMNSHEAGFTIIEILLALTILGILTVFALNMTNSIRAVTKTRETRSRMELIAKKAKDYYRGHRNLPLPAGPRSTVVPAGDNDPPSTVKIPPVTVNDYGDKVPVGVADLDMEQKFRMDAWGRYLQYIVYRNDGASPGGNSRPGAVLIDNLASVPNSELVNIPACSKTLIRGVNVNNRRYAGLLISSGPNQVFEYTTNTTPMGGGGNTTHMVFEKQYNLTQNSDDIFVVIDISEQAMQLAIDGAKALNDKVSAFDSIFTGTGFCEELQVAGDAGVCPPTGGSNDPSCGIPTLNEIKNNSYHSACAVSGFNWGDVTTSWGTVANPFPGEIFNDQARAFIFSFFGLPDHAVYDPWLNGYIWGCIDTVCDLSPMDLTSTDPRVQKFFSAGPDGTIGDVNLVGASPSDDDIIP